MLLISPAELFTAASSGTTLTLTRAVKAANIVYAGPTSGGTAAPAFRGLVAADMPSGYAITTSAEQDIGTLAWTGTSAPSGTINKKYRWSQVGKTVTLFFKIDAAVAGLAITAVSFPLPGDCPTPATFASQPNSTHVTVGAGLIGAAANTGAVMGGSQLTVDGSGNFLVQVVGTGVAATFVWGTVNYLGA